ncbi:iron-sulfur cluster insertion protein ErpA [Buchnera aphidicola (Formosaphis micheliae)]|uniref:iron-sulfur cluster insertion protein ErpA n=1 Tax=Buchnera aphidicola TaxID=9 RepID=UPI0031CC5E63
MKNILMSPLHVSSSVVKKIKKIMQHDKNPNLKLRIYITGGGCSGFQYGFNFDEKINKNDFIIDKQNISIIIDPISLQYLIGGKIDYKENIEGSKFIISNPNVKNTCGCGLSFNM